MLPLSGIRVLDLTRALAGPYCAMMLGDMGADVLKIEMPKTGDETRRWGPPFVNGESGYFISVNRNRRSMTLNLKEPRGKVILSRLVEASDVVLQNFSPGTMEDLGFGYDRLKELNPKVVYCAISGFGQSGPLAKKPAYDLILQGLSGFMSITGPVGGPPTQVGTPIADMVAGMFAAYAIMVALFHRERTGQGQSIDTSLLDGQVALLGVQAQRYFLSGQAPTWEGNRHVTVCPYQMFRTRDGYINMAAGNDSLFARFCTAIGLDDLPRESRFLHNPERVANRDALVEILEERLMQLDTADVEQRLGDAGVPCGPVLNIAQVFANPQVQHLELERVMQHPTAGEIHMTGIPIRLSETPGEMRLPPPLLGQHTDEVLTDLGYSRDAIEALRSDGVI